MRYLFLLVQFIFCMLLTPFFLHSQSLQLPIDEQSKLITYTNVVEVNGPKTELYNRALSWANTFYKNPADVIREKDATAGKIVCKGRFKLMDEPDKKGFQKDQGNVQYTLTIEAKEGKYRYKLSELNWKQTSYYAAERWMDTKNQYYVKAWDFYLKYADENAKKIVADLEQAMKEGPKVKKDDW